MNLKPPATRAEAARFIAPYVEGLYQVHVEIGGNSATFTNALEALRFKLLPQGPHRPSALFAKLVSRIDAEDPGCAETIAGRLNAAYEELISKREDQLWSEPLAAGGLLLHLPEMPVVFGTPPGTSAEEAPAARLTIPSATPLQHDDAELLGRIAHQAVFDGEVRPFTDRLEVGALTFVRASDSTLDLYRNGRRAASVTTFDEFAQRIARPPAADAFVRSWQRYLSDLLPQLQEISALLDQALRASRANMPGDDEEIPFPLNASLQRALDEARLLIRARQAFPQYPLQREWEYSFVAESLAQINNAISGVFTFSEEVMRADAQSALTMLQSPFEPFTYLLRSLAIARHLHPWVRIELDPDAPRDLLPANALPVRQALDRVLYEAGIRHGEEDGGHRVLLSFDAAASRLIITDRTGGGRSAFRAFEPEGTARRELQRLEPEIGGVIEYLPAEGSAPAAPGIPAIGRIAIPVRLAAAAIAGAAAIKPAPVH